MENNENSSEIITHHEISNQETESLNQPKSKPPEIWDTDDRKTFYYLLSKYGKDFQKISSRLNKLRPLKQKNVRQITIFYFQNYKRLSSFVSFSPDIPQEIQQLSVLIAYGEIFKKLGPIDSRQNFPKYLNALIFNRKLSISPKTLKKLGIDSGAKSLKITFPSSKALNCLFKKHESHIPRHLPDTLVLSLKPINVQSLLIAQKAGINPNIQFKVAHAQNIKNLIQILSEKLTETRESLALYLPPETSPMTYKLISSAKKTRLHNNEGEISSNSITAFVPSNSVFSLPHSSPPLEDLNKLWDHGLTAEKALKVSAVDLYLMLGSKTPIELNYGSISPPNSNESWQNLVDFPRSALSCLVDMARSEILQTEVRKATGKSGQIKFNKPCIICRQSTQNTSDIKDEIEAAQSFNFIVPQKRNLPQYSRKTRNNDDNEKRKVKEIRRSVLTPSTMMSQFVLPENSVVNPSKIINDANQSPLQGLIDATLKKPVVKKRYFDLMFDSPSIPVEDFGAGILESSLSPVVVECSNKFCTYDGMKCNLMEDEDTFDMMH